MKIKLIPLDRVEIDRKAVCLGMEKDTVEALLGKGESVRNRQYYFQNELAVDYDDNRRVEFIEFLGGIDGALQPEIYGVSAFASAADDLTALLMRENNGEIDDSEQGYSYCFLNISVGIYRGIRQAEHWDTIGIGVTGYYRR